MGCSAAKNLTVEPLDGGKAAHLSARRNDDERKVSITRSTSDVPPLEGDDPTTEMVENITVNKMQKGLNGMSFEIAFEDEGNESIIKRHPPKRLQRLEEEQQTSPGIALEKLQERLDEAEIRRQQILHQRVQSAKHRNQMKKAASVTSFEEQNDNYLNVPKEEPRDDF